MYGMKVKAGFMPFILSNTVETLCIYDCTSLEKVPRSTSKWKFNACMTTLSHLLMFGPFQRMISSLLMSFKSFLFVMTVSPYQN